MKMLRGRFDEARTAASDKAKKSGQSLFGRARQSIPVPRHSTKAASEITSVEDTSKLQRHTDKQITQKVYRRVGEVVKPTK